MLLLCGAISPLCLLRKPRLTCRFWRQARRTTTAARRPGLDFEVDTPLETLHNYGVFSSKIRGDQSVMRVFAGETALVTGSNSGTGKVVAQQLAERGAHMILSGRDKARSDATAAETRLAEVTEVRNVIVIGSGPSG